MGRSLAALPTRNKNVFKKNTVVAVFIGIILAVCATGQARADGTCAASPSVANSIQSCIDSLSAGGTVSLSAGTYYTAKTIVIKSNIVIDGAGAESTIIQYNGTAIDHVISNQGNAVSDVTIRDVTIRGSNKERTEDEHQQCILITDGNGGKNMRITIRDSIIEECAQGGIHVKGADGVHITYNTLRYNGTDHAHDHNIYLRRVNNAKVELSTSNHSSGNGVNVACSSNVVVRNMTTKYNGQNGIRFAASEYVKAYSSEASYNGYNENGSADTDPCNGLDDQLCNGIELRYEGDDCSMSNVNYACVKDSTANNNYQYWLYIRSATNYELINNTHTGNGAGDEKYVSDSSTSATGVCEQIPQDPTVWPFEKTNDDDADGYNDSSHGGNDCNDANSAIHPGAPETCGDGIDQDCSGSDLVCPPNPCIAEICGNEVDEDCNGGDLSCTDVDNDGDGYTENAGDCRDDVPAISPNAAEICDNIDNNCDGNTDPDCDNDGDGLSNSQEADLGTDPNDSDTDNDGLSDSIEVKMGTNPLTPTDFISPILSIILDSDEDNDTYDATADGGQDCNDADAGVYPGATEICGDGIDQDCSGSDSVCPEDIDNDEDGYTENQGDCDDTNWEVNPGTEEVKGDEVDNDCDGSVDEESSGCGGGETQAEIESQVRAVLKKSPLVSPRLSNAILALVKRNYPFGTADTEEEGLMLLEDWKEALQASGKTTVGALLGDTAAWFHALNAEGLSTELVSIEQFLQKQAARNPSLTGFLTACEKFLTGKQLEQGIYIFGDKL